MPTLALSTDIGYAVAVVAGSQAASWFGAVKVMAARKKYGVKYPALYADSSVPSEARERFNCAQRAHQNTLETLPIVNLMTLTSSLVYPLRAAVFGMTWVVGRFLYIQGYAENGPEGRRIGGLVSHLGDVPLFVTTCMAAYSLITSS